jgi:hypothetical protein
MGNDIPSTIEIRNPSLDSRVKIDIPFTEASQRELLSRDNIIGLCMRSLKEMRDWKNIIERQMEQGKTLQLAWRLDTHLDWIWLEDDVEGNSRDWAVLCGLAMKQVRRYVEWFGHVLNIILGLVYRYSTLGDSSS